MPEKVYLSDDSVIRERDSLSHIIMISHSRFITRSEVINDCHRFQGVARVVVSTF